MSRRFADGWLEYSLPVIAPADLYLLSLMDGGADRLVPDYDVNRSRKLADE
jgi:hypothetical protein